MIDKAQSKTVPTLEKGTQTDTESLKTETKQPKEVHLLKTTYSKKKREHKALGKEVSIVLYQPLTLGFVN